uniref:SUMF1/EgtB/PvdO family nonheme iron enzyme n=1 Tax=Phenylobacterium glaciei TaxID=2803784 RepID=A0A974S8B2_9CAUL|nr:SUMF1/EgtB/PvdO family nonheme iron enzyme [Phenylobacterium glaciei]
MTWIAGGAFRMGSDHHYAEEAPAREAAVAGFWIDTAPVTNRQFARFVRETGWTSFAERTPDPADYPGAPPDALVAGSLVFTPPPAPCPWTIPAAGGATWPAPTGAIPSGPTAVSPACGSTRRPRRLDRRRGLCRLGQG